jgi:ATP-dependent DNA helicase RecG
VSPDTPVQFIKGIGPGRAKALEAAGILTASDLLSFFPFRYEDRRHPVRIAELGQHIDEPVLMRGRVLSTHSHTSPRKRVKIFEIVIEDGTGAIKVVWFNQGFLSGQIKRDDRLSLYGVPRSSSYQALQIESPDWEKFEGDEDEAGSIVPIYSKVTKVPPKSLRKMIAATLDEELPRLADPMPPDIRERLRVTGLAEALEAIHRPVELTADFLTSRSPAHLRVILQEFFTFHLALRVRRATEEVKKKERTIGVDTALRAEIEKILPFTLTDAQLKVCREIEADLEGNRPMYRLLQGDVGSGKTIVAMIAAMIVIRNGHQVALLAPTEILVEQHFQRLQQLLGPSSNGPGIVIAKATGSMTASERRTLLAGLRENYIQLVIGTHALLEEKVKFRSLGLAIIDEQHRFGVAQRQRLFSKGETPDILVMTATPIPRSLALAMYGDLELSVIDRLPPGRQKIVTAVREVYRVERAYSFMDQQIDEGAQIYVVYPIIEESEKLNLKPLSSGFASLQARFPTRRIAMLHGRMSAAEKEETMARFKNGEIDILAATTVIEVGIDVPNASIMMIVGADRFGLSQLHQLRGRVGRGARKSYCILVEGEEAAPEAKERLRIFEQTDDGFEVAARDLEIRGPGEFLGTRQSGAARFRFGNILRDHDLMEMARDVAIEVITRQGAERAEEIVRPLLGVTLATAARD